ncbi:unnamed protein product (macronuclear) [Paramecium tetraurelia]|uniref:Protein kinase domain-containing protein n=1 Tax=Paramecium tetraurelia TaxID=5888 RepID=A0BCN8_PARTE|nr:uncharacterized protein GSPATT00004399001 [Paramecium tetraurelia]CAK56305.1 unnamed protein product [Paramecium tetraurelia]|eukprot:XP_001423703.1 hypothetical protein (macronuclear) [Paramecium tetraurelia strain d4-2]
MLYQLHIVDIEGFENKWYYKLRITNNYNSCYRDVHVRFYDLNYLQKKIMHDYLKLPQFPEKSLFVSWFQINESREELLENKEPVQKYLSGINKNPPFKYDAIYIFVQSTYDPKRTRQLRFLAINKDAFYSTNIKNQVIKKGKFNKVFLVKGVSQDRVIHQFLMPSNDAAKKEYENYKRAQLLITDQNYMVKCHEMGQIIKKKPLFLRKQKKTIYNELEIGLDSAYDIYYAIEDYAQQPMNKLIQERQQKQDHFKLETISEALITLIQVAQYLQFLQVFQKQFSVTNLYYDEKVGFKIGGLSPLYIYKKKYRLKNEINPNAYKALNPPELRGSAGGYSIKNNLNSYIKTDVWQIGIVILSMASLTLPTGLTQSEEIDNKIKQVQSKYGEKLAFLLKNMLQRNQNDRFSIDDIIIPAQQLMPMNQLQLKSIRQIERIQIHSISQQQLEDMDKQFKEKSSEKKYIVHLTIENQIVQQMFLFNLERIKREFVIQLHINVSPQTIPDDLIHKIMQSLADYQHLYLLVFNLKKCTISDEAQKNIIISAQSIQKLKQLTLDISGNQSIPIPQSKIKVVVYNQ